MKFSASGNGLRIGVSESTHGTQACPTWLMPIVAMPCPAIFDPKLVGTMCWFVLVPPPVRTIGHPPGGFGADGRCNVK
jgi:hypothetical protein